MTDLVRETRRTDLRRRLRNAKARKQRAEAEIDQIEADLDALEAVDTLALIRSWRGKLDWKALLEPNQGMHLFMLASFCLDRLGLTIGGIWTDTGHSVIRLSVPTSSDHELAAAVIRQRWNGIETIAPYIKPTEDGTRRFMVFQSDGDALVLHLSADLTVIRLSETAHPTMGDHQAFATIGEALLHIQTQHPGGDAAEWATPIDPLHYPGDSGVALREALTAYLDGCRSAGLPVEHAFTPNPTSCRP